MEIIKSTPKKDWLRASLTEISVYLQMHHRVMEKSLFDIQKLLDLAFEKNINTHSEMLESVYAVFIEFRNEIKKHFAREETILIPYIIQMDSYCENKGPKPEFHSSSLKNPISQIEYEHDQKENVLLSAIRAKADNFELPPGSDEILEALFKALVSLESEVKEHIYLEDKILFPRAIQLELHIM